MACASAGDMMDQSLFGYTKFSDALQSDVGASKDQVTSTLGTDNQIWYDMLRTGGTASVSFSGLTMTTNTASKRMMITVSMMLDTSKIVLPTGSSDIATIFSTGGATQWGLGVRSSGKLCWMWGGNAYGSDLNYTLPTGGSLMLSMVTGFVGGPGEGAQASRIYFGDADTYSDLSGLVSNTSANSLTIGANSAGNNRFIGAIQQLYVHNTSLSLDGVRAFIDEM